MNAMQNLEQRIKDKLAEHQGRIENHRNDLGKQMAQVDQRHQRFTALADRLTAEIIRPRLAKLASFFENAEVLDPERAGRHLGVCVFKHTTRFPATARLELGLSYDRQAANLLLLCRLQILPIFFDFPKQDEHLLPLESVKDDDVAVWFEDKIAAFLDAYLRVETHDHYQTDNMVIDPVCGMSINKLHAAARMDHQGVTYYFCVEDCRNKFAEDPDNYLLEKRASK